MIPDNYDLWSKYDTEQCAKLDRLPVCSYCGEPVQDEYYFLINQEILCQECLDNNFRKETDDYVG